MSGEDRFLRIVETYLTLQGEGVHVGLPCFFVRTAGCDLRCSWCDTPGALQATQGEWWSRARLQAAVPSGVHLVQITGGEPLLQRAGVAEFADWLHARGHKVLLETGGHQSLATVPEHVHVVMDIKLPGSGEAEHDFVANLALLKPSDEVKFVIAGEGDFQATVQWISEHSLAERFQILISPAWGLIEPARLAALLLESGIPARLQLQQHKVIWGAEAQGV